MDEFDKYRVEIFKIAGFAFFAPLGRVFIEPMIVFKEFGLIGTCVFFLVSIGLGTIGFILILKGCAILDVYRRK